MHLNIELEIQDDEKSLPIGMLAAQVTKLVEETIGSYGITPNDVAKLAEEDDQSPPLHPRHGYILVESKNRISGRIIFRAMLKPEDMNSEFGFGEDGAEKFVVGKTTHTINKGALS